MKKIAVVFPGVGYTKDRPLLYYAGKLAAANGYELIHLDFSGIDWKLNRRLKKKIKWTLYLPKTIPPVSVLSLFNFSDNPFFYFQFLCSVFLSSLLSVSFLFSDFFIYPMFEEQMRNK
jgi:hypothetical protein